MQMFWGFMNISFLIVKICNLKEWLSEDNNRREIPTDQLQLTLNELDTHTVAIKGSNIIPVTYSLLANVCNTYLQINVLKN